MRDNNPFYLGDSSDLSHSPICIPPSLPALHLNSLCTFLLFYFYLSLSLFSHLYFIQDGELTALFYRNDFLLIN